MSWKRKLINRKKWINPDPNKIFSYIPGKIVKIFVTEGQEVQEGDSILIFEAMKMKNRLVFHKSGSFLQAFFCDPVGFFVSHQYKIGIFTGFFPVDHENNQKTYN